MHVQSDTGVRSCEERRASSRRAEFMRYFVAGTLSFVSDLALLALLREAFGVSLLVAGAAGFGMGIATSYALAIGWVFPQRSLAHRPGLEFGIYLAAGFLGLAINETVLWGLSEVMGVHYMFAKCVSGIVVLGSTYYVRRRLLFQATQMPEMFANARQRVPARALLGAR